MKETKKQLIERWQSPEGRLLLKNVIDCLKQNRLLSQLSGVGTFDNRFDLRGMNLPKEYTEYVYKGKPVKQVTSSLSFNQTHIENVDFSYADIQQSKWKDCQFRNVKFYGANAEQVEIVNCDFESVLLENTRLSYSDLNIHSGEKSGSFKNVVFRKSALNEAKFNFPTFEHCVFENCNLYATDFDGSRFANCRFIGEMNSPWFRKHSKKGKVRISLFKKIDLTAFSNHMIDVDFSGAKLQYVSFTNDLDLSKCIFPPGTIFDNIPGMVEGRYALTP